MKYWYQLGNHYLTEFRKVDSKTKINAVLSGTSLRNVESISLYEKKNRIHFDIKMQIFSGEVKIMTKTIQIGQDPLSLVSAAHKRGRVAQSVGRILWGRGQTLNHMMRNALSMFTCTYRDLCDFIRTNFTMHSKPVNQ